MNQNRENLDSNGDGERKTKKIDPESKVKSSWPEKLTLPSIQPPVIQEPPSAQQALPSIQPAEKLNLPKVKSAAKRKLPSIPTAGELTLPSIQANASTSVAHNSSIHSTTEEKAKPSAPKPQVEEPPGRPRSSTKRKLPSIPTAGELSLPSNQANASTLMPHNSSILPANEEKAKPSAPKPQIVEPPGTPRSAAKRKLPSIPTAGELSLLSNQANASTSMAHNSSILPTTEEKAKPSAPKPQEEEPPTVEPKVGAILPNIPSQDDLDLPSIEPAVVIVQPNFRSRPRRLLPMLPTIIEETSPVPSEVDDAEESVKKEALPLCTGGLRSVKPKKASKKGSKKPRKLSKGTQTDLQSTEEEVMPSLKTINKEKLAEIPGKTVEHPLEKAPTATSYKQNQPKENHTLSIVQSERDPEELMNESMSGVKPPATEVMPSPQPTLEQALPRLPITRKARPESVPPLNLDQLCSKSPPLMRMNSTSQTTNVELLGNDQEAARQTQKNTKAKRLVPPPNLNQKSSKPPAATLMKLGLKVTDVADGASRQTQTKEEPKRLVPPLNSEQIRPKPPAARRIKSHPKVSDVEPLGNIQGAARQTQTKAEPKRLVQRLNSEQIRPKPPAARRIKSHPKVSDVEPLGNIQGDRKSVV